MTLFYSLAFFFCLFFYSCSSSKPLLGIYRSNFAIGGSFVEQITLKEDSSFEYRSNHVIYKYAKGHYKIDTGKLILSYNFPSLDTSGASYLLRTMGINIEEDRKSMENYFPRYFFNKNGKLFSVNINGKIKRKARTKRFAKKPRKKYYLKKID